MIHLSMFNNYISKELKYWSYALFLLFIVISAWWIAIQIGYYSSDSEREVFGYFYGAMALFGGVSGFFIAKLWGGYKSALGKAILFFSLGLFFQELGQLIYSYYSIFHYIEVPYPSWGDIGFFGSILWYIFGVVYLAKATSVAVSMRNWLSKSQAFIIPFTILIFSYAIFLRGYEFDWEAPLTIFLDFGYPFGQAIYLSLAILVLLFAGRKLGGILQVPTLILLAALFFQYIADFTFLYKSYQDTYITAGITDYAYLFSYFVMSMAILTFGNSYKKIINL